MTIDEAIANEREIAEEQRKDNENCKYKAEYGCKGCADYYSKLCIECAEEHEQLAEWLEKLKARREADRTSDSKPFDVLLAQRYNKAIDDFAEKLKAECREHYIDCDAYFGGITDSILYKDEIDDFAEKLKVGVENDNL